MPSRVIRARPRGTAPGPSELCPSGTGRPSSLLTGPARTDRTNRLPLQRGRREGHEGRDEHSRCHRPPALHRPQWQAGDRDRRRRAPQGERDREADYGRLGSARGAEGRTTARPGRKPGKLVHNVILSMPKGIPPEKLLLASRDFAREEFALKHRYVLTLHTDQDHPHVHLVIKAVSEDGKRLNIRKATLRGWRALFAQHLRAHGVAANATERAVRGRTRSGLKDGIHRALSARRFPTSPRAYSAYRPGASRRRPQAKPWKVEAPQHSPRGDRGLARCG